MEDINKKLIDAAKENNTIKIKHAVLMGGNVNTATEDGWSPILFAAHYGNIDSLIFLIDQGANPNQFNDYHYCNSSPLMEAIQFKHIDCINYLVINGANVNLSNKVGNTALSLLCDRHEPGMLAIIDTLMANGADINCQDSQGRTPIIKLMSQLNQKIELVWVNKLLSYSPDLSIVAEGGYTVFKKAYAIGRDDILDMLEAYQATRDLSKMESLNEENVLEYAY